MRAPQTITVEIESAGNGWKGKVVATGRESHCKAVAKELALSAKAGVQYATYSGVIASHGAELGAHEQILIDRRAARAATPDAIAESLAATTAEAEAQAAALVKAEAQAAEIVARAQASVTQAEKALAAAKARKPAAKAKKAAPANKAAKKATKRAR